ncbi:MAG TPA: peptidase M64 N-terminal domain-containing protein, partial [Pyrinomonadaceae bacterium]
MIIRPLITLIAVLLFVGGVSAAQTMRLDYYHSGDASQEIFSVDRVVIEPLAWPGHPSQALDTSNLGKYFFEVRDAKTKQVLFSRG